MCIFALQEKWPSNEMTVPPLAPSSFQFETPGVKYSKSQLRQFCFCETYIYAACIITEPDPPLFSVGEVDKMEKLSLVLQKLTGSLSLSLVVTLSNRLDLACYTMLCSYPSALNTKNVAGHIHRHHQEKDVMLSVKTTSV